MAVKWRYAVIFAMVAVGAGLVLAAGATDQMPLWLVDLLAPGFLLRGIASHSELGFADWRDPALTITGTATAWTATLFILHRGWRAIRRRASRGSVV